MEPSSLPVIDVSQLFCDRQAILKVAAQIDEACRTWGFFYIIGHGIPAERFQKLTEMAKAFFSLPLEEKLKIDIQKSKHHRGYGGVGTEYLDPANPTDYKETFDMGCNLPEDHPAVVAGKPLRGPNRHPTGVEGWAELMENHYRGMHELSLILLRALAMAIGIEDDFFDSRFFEPLSVFRMIYYPVLSAKEGERVVCGEHTDYGVMTLLYQDDATGLQVRNLSGEWMDVPPLQGSLVVNIGDMMAMWSNGRYKSTPHRVINPGVERISMPFFCEPNPDALITCLDHCKSPENPAKFPTVRASDWLQKRFAQTYEYRRVL